MGLDQIAYKLKKNFINKNVDFSLNDIARYGGGAVALAEMDEFAFWRKHWHFDQFMEKLYFNKGGKEEIFNCCWLKLSAKDLDNLEIHLQIDQKYKEYDQYQEYEGELKDYDAKFIAQARDALKNGFDIIYTNNW